MEIGFLGIHDLFPQHEEITAKGHAAKTSMGSKESECSALVAEVDFLPHMTIL